MYRRVVGPILRIVLFLLILSAPFVLAAVAQAEPAGDGHALVTLGTVSLAENPDRPSRAAATVGPSRPATLLDARGTKFLVQVTTTAGPKQGWADAASFLVLDDPATPIETLLDRARLVSAQGDRPVLAAAVLSEVVRRDAARVEAWRLLGAVGERLASTSRPDADGQDPVSVALASTWGLKLVRTPDGIRYRYDGAAYRRLVALSPSPEAAEEARLRLLRRCGPVVDVRRVTDVPAAESRERDLGEFLASFPNSTERLALLVERARLVSALAEIKAREGDEEGAATRRDAALAAASEILSLAPRAAERREADRMVARLTRSFPRKLASDRVVVSGAGVRARFVVRGGGTLLEVVATDGKALVQPHPVLRPDPATLVFDATGRKLAWDEAPEPGRRRTRVLHLDEARLVEPAGLWQPEVMTPTGAAVALGDRYTSLLGFSPDGTRVLLETEGFTADGIRVPKRFLLCDSNGRSQPVVVERPFAGPGRVDWGRISGVESRVPGRADA